MELSRRPLVEAVLMFLGIMAYIWVVRPFAPWTWILLAGALLLSHRMRGESPARLAFDATHLRESVAAVAPWLAVIAAAIMAAGASLHSIHAPAIVDAGKSLGLYLLWGLAQQYLLNVYFARRFSQALPFASRGGIAVATGLLFALAHIPNGFLMGVTFIGGAAAVAAYLRYRTLYALAVAHGVIGFLLTYSMPDDVTHHLRIGPGYFEYRSDEVTSSIPKPPSWIR